MRKELALKEHEKRFINKPWPVPPRPKPNPRRFLRPVHVLLLFIEWAAVMVTNVAETVTNSIKDLTLALESYINADPKPDKPEPGN
jgi:hypothetical protein